MIREILRCIIHQREHLALSKRLAIIELLEKEITFSEVGELFIPEGVNLSTPNQMGLYIQVLEEYMGASNREGGESNVSDASESFKIDIDKIMVERKLNQVVLQMESGNEALGLDDSDKENVGND